ncbi:hypothetical protein B0T17DRAFT_80554 [Bombardia bombarda]|uniref:Uncharacterized protein n=1 Tax=Bombardia bombarda TaxID=252184 RepID=A0AA40CGF5_9PEZI|nr:hypothetical protein B0T17DRAFT_80554 [Bombardia bombarda]
MDACVTVRVGKCDPSGPLAPIACLVVYAVSPCRRPRNHGNASGDHCPCPHCSVWCGSWRGQTQFSSSGPKPHPPTLSLTLLWLRAKKKTPCQVLWLTPKPMFFRALYLFQPLRAHAQPWHLPCQYLLHRFYLPIPPQYALSWCGCNMQPILFEWPGNVTAGICICRGRTQEKKVPGLWNWRLSKCPSTTYSSGRFKLSMSWRGTRKFLC